MLTCRPTCEFLYIIKQLVLVRVSRDLESEVEAVWWKVEEGLTMCKHAAISGGCMHIGEGCVP